MKFQKKYLIVPLLVVMTSSLHAASDLVSRSWGEIRGFLTTEGDAPAPQVQNTADLRNKVAELVDNQEIRVSGAFVSKVENSGLNADKQKEIMLFLIGHEVAHKYLPKNSPDVEYQADFMAALFVGAMNPNYLSAAQTFFSFAEREEILKTDKTHGSASERQQRLAKNSEEIRRLRQRFAEIMESLASNDPATVRSAIVAVEAFAAEIQKPGFAEFTGFGLAIAVARHKVWMLGAKNKELGVQVSLYVPKHPETKRGSKGAKDIPGDKALFYKAKGEYEKYRKSSPGDTKAELNYLTLIAYEGEGESLKLFKKLQSGNFNDAQSLNNLGVAAYILTENGKLEKGTAISLLEKARGAKTGDDAHERDIEAKILFNLARANAQAGKSAEAAGLMKQYRAHDFADFCWRREDYSCPAATGGRNKLTQFQDFRIGMTTKEAQATAKSSFKDCVTGKIEAVSATEATLEITCNSTQSEFRLAFTNGKLALVQFSGENNKLAALRIEDKGALTLGQSSIEVQNMLGDYPQSKVNQLRFKEIGLYIILDNRQKVYSMAIGDGTHMDWTRIRR